MLRRCRERQRGLPGTSLGREVQLWEAGAAALSNRAQLEGGSSSPIQQLSLTDLSGNPAQQLG